ncbi:MAG TPA: PAS domain-containing protein [Gaiellaceae bacterium]
MTDLDVSLIDRLTIPASLHDVEGRFLHLNAAGERASGFSSAKLRGRSFTEPVPPQARAAVTAQFRRAVESGEPTDFETVFVDGNGDVRGVRAQHLPLLEGDVVVGVLILAYDVRQPADPRKLGGETKLTRRQREILELVAAGTSTADIAAELSLSVETVRNHLRGLLHELDAHTRVEAVAVAQRLGLLPPRPFRT